MSAFECKIDTSKPKIVTVNVNSKKENNNNVKIVVKFTLNADQKGNSDIILCCFIIDRL